MDQNTLLRLPANVDGRKTYLIAALIGGGAALLWLFGAADSKEALLGLLNAGALAALRHALAKLPADQQALIERAIELYRSVSQRLDERLREGVTTAAAERLPTGWDAQEIAESLRQKGYWVAPLTVSTPSPQAPADLAAAHSELQIFPPPSAES